jgi:DNA-binding protein HU-beta
MNKKETIIRMSKDAGITALQAAKAFSSLLEGVKNTLRKGGKVTFSGFGSFEVKQRRARKGRNPKTGAEVAIPPKNRIKFNPSKSLKNSL